MAPIFRKIAWVLVFCALAAGLGAGLGTVSVVHAQSSAENIAAENGATLLEQFLRENPRARQHKLGLVSEAYTEDPSNPALRLNRLWVSDNATLLEIEGLKRVGRSDSAVISFTSLRLIDASGKEHSPIGFRGVAQVRDKKGGVALMVQPGDKLYLLMPGIDDFRPFALAYIGADLQFSRYFDDIDPRYRERYDTLAERALDSGATPEQMRDFLVEFARDDPEKKAPQVFLALINKMRGQNSFEGFYNAYLLIQDPADAKAALALAKTNLQRAQIENMAVSTLVDKGRLLDMQFQMLPNSTQTGEGKCLMPCSANFRASRTFAGSLLVKAKTSDTPIRLRAGTYKVTFDTELVLPRWYLRDAPQLGKADQRSDEIRRGKVVVTLAPPNYSASVNVEFGSFDLVFFERGIAGGYSAYWADGDARASLKFRSMELSE
jgi:hypothetical protein